MDIKTVSKLNKINQEFYQAIAGEFDSTRNYFWTGWDKLLEFIDINKIKTVLDVGCGNGRFAEYLCEHGNNNFNYIGIDSCDYLLEQADKSLSKLKINYVLLNKDFILEKDFDLNKKYDLVVAFGVLHHIPGFDNRKKFIEMLINLKNKNGNALFSFWNFAKNDRFKNKIIAWDKSGLGVNLEELEPRDFLLNWGGTSDHLRYCHECNSEELKKLLTVNIKQEWQGDKFNKYVLI